MSDFSHNSANKRDFSPQKMNQWFDSNIICIYIHQNTADQTLWQMTWVGIVTQQQKDSTAVSTALELQTEMLYIRLLTCQIITTNSKIFFFISYEADLKGVLIKDFTKH